MRLLSLKSRIVRMTVGIMILEEILPPAFGEILTAQESQNEQLLPTRKAITLSRCYQLHPIPTRILLSLGGSLLGDSGKSANLPTQSTQQNE